MKIVCEACQAKYSISDDKVRGKAFKIRCKKCSHIIVVRSADGSAASSSGSSPAISTAPPADNSWHIVVDGEQVGPLSASDIRGRLSRGEIGGETYIWREGLADWMKVSAVPEFAERGDEDGASPFPSSPAAAAYPPGTADSAFAAPSSDASDVFASPSHTSSPMSSADLFASPVSSSPEPEQRAPASSPSFASFGAPEAASVRVGGNGAGMATSGGGGGLTGQRHENSVLFSLSNLEALASPSAPASSMPRPGVSSGPSEGSGLIDIRSMAAMTLGSSTAESRPSADLPTFGAPQFSPVAPVLLPIGSSGPPKWLYAVLALLILLAGSLGIVTYKFLTARPPVVVQPAAPPAAPVVATAPAKAASKETAPPTSPPPAANEALPPREDKAGGEKTAAPKAPRSQKVVRSPRSGGGSPGVAVAPPPPIKADAPERPNVGKGDKLDELLNSAMGNRNRPPGRPDEEAPKRAAAPAASLPKLERDDIVRAMQGVQPKVKDCFNQYKVPGTAMVSMNVARGGKVSSATVTGKFAGTPTGACVANAAKSAKFPPVEAYDGLSYPFPLH
jgi:predicted Zn finger-like uncharacterized protein